MREREIEKYLACCIKTLGGECRKIQWVGRNGAPDRLVMLHGRTVFFELKSSAGVTHKRQTREHLRMRKMGQAVHVVNSKSEIDTILKTLVGEHDSIL